ncbi:MAG: preprotein translocase subunit YajC [Legionellales bacterium]|nr:preprotein translocase subunit YajC [Legionellales bacterium]
MSINLISVAEAATTAPIDPSQQHASFLPMLIMLGGLFLLMYFVAWGPQRKKMQQHRNLIENLSKGDEVVTTGGVMGKITKINDTTIALQIADNVEIRLQKQCIHAVLPKGTLKSYE